ncbi:MAG: cytochrome C [bacterium]|nr:cytochrome C [bacterium]
MKFFDTGSKDDTSSCTRCHIGYGWIDDSFDFSREENVDCLVCHDWTAAYTKGRGGMPAKDVDLLEVARRVGYPWRDNCGSCHLFGNRGMGIKHGDLDSSLLNPTENTDVHMGKHSFLCIDCHKASNHKIAGKAYLVNPGHEKGIKCTHCHLEPPHNDSQINMHLSSVACQTCHIPEFAKKFPTKIGWDQSKGQFLYGKNVVPVYYWFNLKSHRLIPGDKITPGETTYLNKPDGDISQRASLIRPFKTFQSMLPYDNLSNRLLPPLNIQQKCLQSESEFSRILIANAGKNNIPYTGKYTLIKTVMLRPLSHMVAPANKALQCIDCHGANSRMDWKALGYEGDPEVFGGRNTD